MSDVKNIGDCPQPAFAEILGEHYDPDYEYRVLPMEEDEPGWEMCTDMEGGVLEWDYDNHPSSSPILRRAKRPPTDPAVQTPEQAAKLHAGKPAAYDEPYVICCGDLWMAGVERMSHSHVQRAWLKTQHQGTATTSLFAVPLRLVPPEQRSRYAVCVKGDGEWIIPKGAHHTDGDRLFSTNCVGEASYPFIYLLSYTSPPTTKKTVTREWTMLEAAKAEWVSEGDGSKYSRIIEVRATGVYLSIAHKIKYVSYRTLKRAYRAGSPGIPWEDMKPCHVEEEVEEPMWEVVE